MAMIILVYRSFLDGRSIPYLTCIMSTVGRLYYFYEFLKKTQNLDAYHAVYTQGSSLDRFEKRIEYQSALNGVESSVTGKINVM